jgi:hypothetical protein
MMVIGNPKPNLEMQSMLHWPRRLNSPSNWQTKELVEVEVEVEVEGEADKVPSN